MPLPRPRLTTIEMNALQHTDCRLSMDPPDGRDVLLDQNYYENNSSDICVAKYPASNNNTYQENVYVAPGSEWLPAAAAKRIILNVGLTSTSSSSARFAMPPPPMHTGESSLV